MNLVEKIRETYKERNKYKYDKVEKSMHGLVYLIALNKL